MEIVEMDANGRIYIPVSIRRRLSARRFRAVLEGDRLVLLPLNVEDLYGAFSPPRYDTPEGIDRAVVEEATRILRDDIH